MKIKGHTTIELRNVVTGEVKKYEDDNTFTSAIGQMISFASRHGYQNTWGPYSTHTYNLLGGLILFSNPVNPNSLFPEAGNTPIGYGSVGDTNSYTGMTEWGIYNPQESDLSSNTTKKMVWDFSTSHANGQISAVCLTHKNAGIMGAGISSAINTGRSINRYITTGTIVTQSKKGRQGKNENGYVTKGASLSLNNAGIGDFCLDSVNDLKYQFRVCDDGMGIIKFSTHPEKFDMFRSSVEWQGFTEETYSADFSDYGTYVYHFYNPDEKMLYFWMYTSNTSTVNAGITIKIHRFDMTNKVLTKDWNTITFQDNQSWISGMIITNTAAYFISGYTNDKFISKYVFSSGIVTHFILPSNAQMGAFRANNSYIMNGLITFNWVTPAGQTEYYNDIFFDPILEQVRYTNFRGHYLYYSLDRMLDTGNIPPIDSSQVIYVANANLGETQTDQSMMNFQQYASNTTLYGNTHAPCNYLGTINNLQESVTKTEQQTMKVTYTITAVELE